MSLRLSLALATLGMTIAACGPVNQGVESVNQPVVQRTDYVFDAGTAGNALASGERERLESWFSSLELGYGDRVSIDSSAVYGAIGGREEVAAVVARFGLLISDAAPKLASGITPGAIRVIVSRTQASVSNCPNWNRPSMPEFSASSMSNYGCATNSNLAAMVANPEDLIRGRTASPVGDAAVAYKAIDAYRNAAPTGKNGLKSETAGSTK